ncbi:glycoside hydrolase family 76 protein [Streptomyces sp. NBC_01352]|uniref:glycoside hydrolase family 76 protein n=1 Tax=unclassified Streptomyces TaxID=2593676 RepID=UPI0022589A6C|nr:MULTISPECIES: glycoside hydrolase family 76 protein [unclassified Streptomyces]MCX4703613.1 glycoside hydrolase family 76 protein [Streptomyces sp. NBC_01373]
MLAQLRRARAAVGAFALGAALVLVAGALPAQASTPSTSSAPGAAVNARDRATAAVEAMMGFYDEDTGRWDPDAPWWQSGNALQALLDYTAKTRSKRYLLQIENTIEQQRKPLPWWPEGGGEFRADSTDDTGWWGLAMTSMYDLTRDQEYLTIAKLDEEYMYKYWDDVCGGGVWWDIPAATYKNAISVELYIKLAAALHNRIPGDTVYLKRALTAWKWLKSSGMINGDNLVNDGLNTQGGGCANNGGITWTYNQGVVLGGLAELYKATGDRALLRDARKIADAVVDSPLLSPKGILTEPCEASDTCESDGTAFKGIFARNLGELDALLPGRPYRGYLLTQARSAYQYDRNSSDQYGVSWSGPFDRASIGRQESAVSLLVSVL